MKYFLFFLPVCLFFIPPLHAQNNCTQTLPLSAETVTKIFAALKDHSIRGESAASSSPEDTEWHAVVCLEKQLMNGDVFAGKYSTGVRFTFMQNGKEKEANKLFDQIGELLDNTKPAGWISKLEEYEITHDVFFYLRDQDPHKTMEVRLKVEGNAGKYNVFLWFEIFS